MFHFKKNLKPLLLALATIQVYLVSYFLPPMIDKVYGDSPVSNPNTPLTDPHTGSVGCGGGCGGCSAGSAGCGGCDNGSSSGSDGTGGSGGSAGCEGSE